MTHRAAPVRDLPLPRRPAALQHKQRRHRPHPHLNIRPPQHWQKHPHVVGGGTMQAHTYARASTHHNIYLLTHCYMHHSLLTDIRTHGHHLYANKNRHTHTRAHQHPWKAGTKNTGFSSMLSLQPCAKNNHCSASEHIGSSHCI